MKCDKYKHRERCSSHNTKRKQRRHCAFPFSRWGIEADEITWSEMLSNRNWSWVPAGNRWACAYQLVPCPQSPLFYVWAVLHNLINSFNNDDRQEKKIIANHEKNATCVQQNQDRESGLPSTRECWEFNN